MTEPDTRPIVSIHDVHKSFGDVEVLKGISMDVPKGGVVCIIGPSGSGKSTLLRCINALVPIDSGSIRVADFDVHLLKTDKERLALRREVSIVFQQYNLFPHKTALENVMMAPMYVLREPREEVRARAIALLKKVGLAAKQDVYPGELSGGQQPRELADTVYFTDGGVIVESGPPAELFDRPKVERTRAFLSQIL
jgi:polar amino acid transport system ATP-binding protein